MKNNSISEAAHNIKNGGLVDFLTETGYGLGANAFNPFCVNEIVMYLAKYFWPGLLTIVLPKSPIVPDFVDTSCLDTVRIHMPDNPIALELIKESRCPMATPSANKFLQLRPVSAHHVKQAIL